MNFRDLLARHPIAAVSDRVAGYDEYARVTDLERGQRLSDGG
jgi:hypothetical protein